MASHVRHLRLGIEVSLHGASNVQAYVSGLVALKRGRGKVSAVAAIILKDFLSFSVLVAE